MIHAIFHGHAFVEIEFNDKSILIDPFFSENEKSDIDLKNILNKNIIAIILTHWHFDHLWAAVEICEKTWCLLIWTSELTNYFKQVKWIKNIHAMHIGWEHDFDGFNIKLVSAIHWPGLDQFGNWWSCTPSWVIVRIWDKSIYHAGDTALTYDMKLLWDFDKIDLAFLPIWGNYTMWVADAVIATWFIKPGIVVPIHYNTWDIISANPIEFSRRVMLENLSIPKVLNPWQFIVLE